MDSKPNEVPIPATAKKSVEVPEELLGKLHEAREELSRSRENMEEVLDDYGKGLEAREQSIEEVSKAGERVDELGRQVTEGIDAACEDKTDGTSAPK